jgi:phage repressor protein C with HTH and peptisase S24 domain
MKSDPHERLAKAREQAGYAQPTDAARAMGLKQTSTYLSHENGTRGLSRAAARYAAFFRVSLEWLLTGRGDMQARPRGVRRAIAIGGLVGAGAAIMPIRENTAGTGQIDEIELPDEEFLGALEVRGDSQYPRYLDGEIVIYDTRPEGPGRLLNRYAVVDTVDGRRLLKILRKMPHPGRFRLESHNAVPEDDVEIVAAYRVKGTLER